METFESPYHEIAGVVVLRDHKFSNMFHYLAGPPKLTVDEHGVPSLLLLKYREALDAMSASPKTRDELGGGFLLLGVDCELSEETKAEIVRELETRTPPGSGPVTLVPVLYTKGTVSIVALDAQQAVAGEPEGDPQEHSRFVRGIQGSATPSLLQGQRAIFSLSLSPSAATLIEEAYDSDLSPIGVMFELEFTALRPAIAVKAHVDRTQVYEQLKLAFHGGVRTGGGGSAQPAGGERTAGSEQPRENTKPKGFALSVDIGWEMEKLVQSGAIKLDIIRQQEGKTVDEMQKDALDLLKETLLKEFFKPAMSDSTMTAAQAAEAAAAAAKKIQAGSEEVNKGSAGGAGAVVEIGFQLQMKRREELGTADYDFSVVAPETRTHAPNGFFSALLTGTERDRHIRSVPLDDAFFEAVGVDITTTADFAALDLKTVAVDLQYGGTPAAPRVVGSATFTPTDPQPHHFQAFRDEDDFTYRYRVDYKFGQAESIAAQRQDYETPWKTEISRALVIHPPEDVAMLRVFVEPGVVDWEVVETIETQLDYDDPDNDFHAQRTFLVEQDSPRRDWLVRLTDPARTGYTMRHRWHLKDQSTIEGEPQATDVAHLFVADPFVDRLPIVLQPLVDRTNVVRVDVELQYEDPGNHLDVRKNVELLGPDFHPVTVTIPIIDPDRREFTYRATLTKTNGTSERQAPVATERLSIPITEGGIYFDVQVVLLGSMEAAGIQAVQVDLRSEPLEGDRQRTESHLFEPGQENRTIKRLLLRADRPQRFEYRTTVFLADRDPVERDWTEHENSNLILQPQRLVSG
jgi:hypothetical protein